jgi:hypothetical protein
MATYLTSHPVRRAANRLFAFRNHYNSLSESVLTGLGMFWTCDEWDVSRCTRTLSFRGSEKWA